MTFSYFLSVGFLFRDISQRQWGSEKKKIKIQSQGKAKNTFFISNFFFILKVNFRIPELKKINLGIDAICVGAVT